MIGRPLRQRRFHHPGLFDGDRAAVEELVQRRQSQERGERAELLQRRCRLGEAVAREDVLLKGVAPVVVVTDNDRWQVSGLTEAVVMQQMLDLPATFLLRSPRCQLTT